MENINLDQLKEQGYEIGGQEYDSKNFVPQRAVNLDPKIEGTTKKRGRPTHQSLDDEIQATLLEVLNGYKDDKEYQKTKYPKYRASKAKLAKLMERRGTKKVCLTGTNFEANLVPKDKWTYDNDHARLKKELKDEEERQRDCGIATNDRTYYVSPVSKK